MALENEFMIQEAFAVGLRNSKRPALNGNGLVTCLNLKPTESGLEIHDNPAFKEASFARSTTGSFANLITNGTFTTDTAWTKGGTWVIDSNVASVNDPASSDAYQQYYDVANPRNTLSQSLSGSLSAGSIYRLSVDITAHTSGQLEAYLGSDISTAKRIVFDDGNRKVPIVGTHTAAFEYVSGETPTLLFVARGRTDDFSGEGPVFSIDNVTVALVEAYYWPYPQLFKMQNHTLLLAYDSGDYTRVYEVDESADWEQATYDYHTKLTIMNGYQPTEAYTFAGASADPWHVADFGGVYFLCDGNVLIAKMPSSGVTNSSYLVAIDDLNIGAVGKYRSRMYWGGVGVTATNNPNIIVNGTFDKSGDTDYGWSLQTGWAVTDGKLVATATNLTAVQKYPYVNLTPGASYTLTFTTSDVSGGSVTAYVGADAGTERSTNDTFAEAFTAIGGGANSEVYFDASGFTGKIDNVILKRTSASDYFDSDAWDTIWQTWLKYVGENDPYSLTAEDMTFSTNWICWSQVAGGDVFYPFAEFMAMFSIPNNTYYDKLLPNILESIRSGDMGFLQMPWEGEIYYLSELGDHLIVYGENGVSAVNMNPQSRLHTVQTVLSIGVIGRGAVAGDEKEHIFLDKSGTLWRILPGPQLERLDFRQYLYEDMADSYTTDSIVISLDQRTREYYICNSTKGYLLSNNRLSQISALPSTIQYIDGVAAGFAINPSGDSTFTARSDTFDLGNRGVKTIHNVHLGFYDADNVQIQVEYRYADSPQWYSNTAQDISDEGIVTPIVSGVDFRLVITGTLKEDTKIHYANVRWRQSDKRSVRGRL